MWVETEKGDGHTLMTALVHIVQYRLPAGHAYQDLPGLVWFFGVTVPAQFQ